jgi:hypothetical protein
LRHAINRLDSSLRRERCEARFSVTACAHRAEMPTPRLPKALTSVTIRMRARWTAHSVQRPDRADSKPIEEAANASNHFDSQLRTSWRLRFRSVFRRARERARVIDYNGHLNVGYYHVAFDAASSLLRFPSG